MKDFWSTIFASWKRTCITLFKILVPVSIIVKVLQMTGWIEYVAVFFDPMMRLLGLPGEMSLVLASAVFGNVYSGLLTFFSIETAVPLTTAQVTIVFAAILVAHNFLVEVAVTYKAGFRIIPMVLLRLVMAVLMGLFLKYFYLLTGWLQEPARLIVAPMAGQASLWLWAWGEVKKYLVIAAIILLLIAFLEMLKRTGAMDKFTQWIRPAVRLIGMNECIIPTTLIGLTLGLAYGGALIIEESKRPDVRQRDVAYSLFLMAIYHSLIEDTMLMVAMGGHWSGILMLRTIFAFFMTWLFIRITRNWSDDKMAKWITVRPKQPVSQQG